MLNVTETVKAIADRSMQTPAAPGDYAGEDGLARCGVCHEPKEIMLELGGQTIKARCLCRCGVAAREAAEAEERRKQQEELRREWLRGFEGMTFAADNGKNPTLEFARRYVARWPEILKDGLSFTLSGGVGCGKTYAAAAIAHAVLEQGHRVWMVTAPALVDMMGWESAEKALNRLRVFDLVVIDDLGAERGTEYAQQRIFDAIDARKNSGLPTIITTNLDFEAGREDLTYQRIVSRVCGFAPQFRCRGEDMRQEKGAAARKTIREVLADG